MRPIIIHIGPHKTGSTTIQHSLNQNQDRLRHFGFKIPRIRSAFKDPSKSHRLLVNPVGDGTVAASPVWSDLLGAAAASSRTFIITSELLSTKFLDRRNADLLVAELGRRGFRPKFVYFARDQVSWINSTYVQVTKRTYTWAGFPDYVAEALTNPRFDHMQMTAAFQNRGDLDIAAVHFATAARQGLLRTFLTCIGIPEADTARFELESPANPNAGTRTVVLGRDLARAKVKLGMEPTDTAMARHLKYIYRRRNWTREPFQGFDDGLAERVRAGFAESNRAFSQVFALPAWHEVHPPKPMVRCEYVAAERSILENLELRYFRARLMATLRRHVAGGRS